MGLSHKTNASPFELSGGQQNFAHLQALCDATKVLVLDGLPADLIPTIIQAQKNYQRRS